MLKIKTMRITYLLLLWFPFISWANLSQQGPAPGWVNSVNADDTETGADEQGFRYLLLDFQDNITTQESYRHYVIQVSSAQGIQEVSDISTSFDPSYSALTFHQVRIIRGREEIDKLKNSEIKEFQRETSMERSLYDGSITALINLTDVREGDILEYSFTIKGYNPINQGNYSNSFYQQYAIPVNRIYSRVIEDPDKPLNFKYFDEAASPQINTNQGLKNYTWDIKAKDVIQYDSNTPSWFNAQPRVEASTFENWGDVANWALPLYGYDDRKIAGLVKELRLGKAPLPQKVHEMIRFVQDDIRYLGLESGIGAYKPHEPSEVFAQKYGDCKDKSLLLVALLRNQGVEAYPLLVNSSASFNLNESIASQGAFNHCVVQYNLEDKSYFVDPTISDQGGDPENMEFPNYHYGLLLKPGEQALTPIDKQNVSVSDVLERFVIDDLEGPVTFTVKTTYSGFKADLIRREFNNSSDESIQNSYLDFYSSLYPGISSTQPIAFEDYERSGSNRVVVREFYEIDDFWSYTTDSITMQTEIGPLVLATSLNFPNTAKRKHPYYLGDPYEFSQVTEITFPEPWDIQESNTNISGPGFEYASNVAGYGQNVSISHSFQLLEEHISSEEVAEFLQKIEQVTDDLSFFINRPNENYVAESDSPVSWISLALTLLAVGFGIFFAMRTYQNYDPEPWEYAENLPIGGWLILPAIGLCITPFRLILQIIDLELYDPMLWTNVMSLDIANKSEFILYIAASIVYNGLYFVFTIFILILFFMRRSSLPRLITIFYAVNIIGPGLDALAGELIVPELMDPNEQNVTMAGLARTIIGAAIWIPYFNYSERSKSTFCIQHRPTKDPYASPYET